jgi:hypothetical protein
MNLKFLFLLLCLSSSIAAQNLPETDTQLWTDISVTKPLVKGQDRKGKEFDRVSIVFNGTMRFGNHLQAFIDQRLSLGFDIKVNSFLTLTPAYLYRSERPALNRRQYESRFRFAATLEKKWTRFSLKDRNLVEYRLRNSRADSTRYRNRLTFSYPILKGKKEIFAPYLADEVFYDFSARLWTRNEFSAGISRKLTKNLTGDFYYLRQQNRSGTPRALNVIGINLKVKLD